MTQIHFAEVIFDQPPAVHLNTVAASKGNPLVHLTVGPVELSLMTSAEAQQFADAFTEAARLLAEVEANPAGA